MLFKTPVILLIFRRPELTARVFEAIRQLQPEKLIVIADGPRNQSEEVLCNQARMVTEQVDWNCKVLRSYSPKNLGCRTSVSSGLNWAFEQVNEAIILEDDCLPHPSFFNYCETLLSRYSDDERVMVISGNNFQDGKERNSHSYYFSKYNHCWGWATWKRAWKHWELNSERWIEFRDNKLMQSVCQAPYEQAYWTDTFNKLFLEGKPDSWAYAWTFACWAQNGLTALPNKNLVSNIGFGVDATHTKNSSVYSQMPTYDIGKITHPTLIVRDEQADRYTFDTLFGGETARKNRTLLKKLKRQLHTLCS